MNDRVPAIWEDVIRKSNQQSPYYLLIGRQTNFDGSKNEIKVELKLPSSGPFSCINENYKQVIKTAIEIAVKQKGSVADYPANILNAVNTLHTYVKRVNGCCSEGQFLSSCGCPINLNEIRNVLISKGFNEIQANQINVSDYAYTHLDSEYKVELVYEASSTVLTDEIEFFSEFHSMNSKVSYFNSDNCEDLLDFKEISLEGKEVSEELIIIAFTETPIVFTKTKAEQSSLREVSSKQKLLFHWAAYWLIKKAIMAGTGVLFDIAMNVAIEKVMGGHNTWFQAWEATKLNGSELLSAAISGAFADKKLLDFVASSLAIPLNYLINTDTKDWDIEQFGLKVGTGVLTSAVGVLAGEVIQKVGKSVVKHFPGLGPKKDDITRDLFLAFSKKPSLILKLRGVAKAWEVLNLLPHWTKKDIGLLEKIANKPYLAPNITEYSKKAIPKSTPKGFNGAGTYSGVKFNSFGHPELKPHVSDVNHIVSIDMKGNYTSDMTAAKDALKAKLPANEKLTKSNPNGGWSPFYIEKNGLKSGPYTWHHHQDGSRMYPVKKEIHDKIIGKHTGGREIILKYPELKGFFTED